MQPRLGTSGKTLKTKFVSRPEPKSQEMSAFKKAQIDRAIKTEVEKENTSTGQGRRRRSNKTRKVRKSRRRH